MGRLLALAIIAGVIYLALTQGMPWLKTAVGSGAGAAGGGESADCVARASDASDTVAGELVPQARPPVDTAVWGTVLLRAGGALAQAETACACPADACATATEAIYELRAMFDELDDIARGNPMGIGNPARRQERVNQLLDRARAEARSE